MRRWVRVLLWVAGVMGALTLAAVIFWNTSPWPSVWLVRSAGDPGGLKNAETAAALAPDGIHSDLDVIYDPSSAQGRMDIFWPDDADGPLPVVFWVHGGGFIAGEKEPLRDYLRIVASHGFTVVSVEYTHAPEATYPTPVIQANAAISAALANADAFHIDPERIIIAGDSAGAHIAAQTVMVNVQPDYANAATLEPAVSAAQIVGSVQFSGPYDPTSVDYDNAAFGFFMRTVMWSYSGTKDFLHVEHFMFTALPEHVDRRYPPTFVSTGPADPLLKQNVEWVAALEEEGVDVTTLFFDPANVPGTVGHEYQLALDTPEARQAMTAYVAFIRDVTGAEYRPGVSDSW